MELNGTITDVPGIEAGHAANVEALTGCTVILCRKGAVGGVDQRGGAPGTRETDLLRPMHLVQKVHGILLSGGSAFGLDAAAGVMRYLEENKIGFYTGNARVPIVPAAVIYDLGVGSSQIRPDAEMGYQACLNASRATLAQGNAGAGMGATAGKLFGMGQAVKSGTGSASVSAGGGFIVGAVAVVNPFGDVIDPENGKIIAGTRKTGKTKIGPEEEDPFADTLKSMKSITGRLIMKIAAHSNTVIGCVAVNASFSKEETNKIAQMAHDGLARTIRPAHTMMDGDTIFALSTGRRKADVSLIGACAAEAFAQAVISAVKNAESIGNIPGYKK